MDQDGQSGAICQNRAATANDLCPKRRDFGKSRYIRFALYFFKDLKEFIRFRGLSNGSECDFDAHCRWVGETGASSFDGAEHGNLRRVSNRRRVLSLPCLLSPLIPESSSIADCGFKIAEWWGGSKDIWDKWDISG